MLAEYTETAYHCNTNLDIPREKRTRHYIPMGYLDRLKVLRKRKHMTQAALAEAMGVEQPTVQRWEKGKREPSLEQLIKLAHILDVEPGALIDPMLAVSTGPRLFIKGEVAAGVWKEAFELPEDEWLSFTGRDDVTADTEHRFGLRVLGDSMDEVYPPGTIIECVSTFGRIEPRPGRRVVIVRRNENNEVEATVKELVEQGGDLWAVPRSSNPVHTPIKLNGPEPGIVETRIAAVVVASVRPE